MRTYVEKFVAVEARTELDMESPHYDGDECNEVMIPQHKLHYAEAPSMDIDDVMSLLNELKDKGANRIYIAQHCDHNGYYFYGVELKEI